MVGLAETAKKGYSCDSDIVLDPAIIATKPSDLRFVVNKTTDISDGPTCPYEDGYSIVPQRINWHVVVYDLKKEKEILKKTFSGPLYDCPWVYTFVIGGSTPHEVGDEPKREEVTKYLKQNLLYLR